MLINSYAIMDPDRRNLLGRIGTVVYVTGSAHDHSCVPNAVQLFDGTKLQIRALREFDAKQEPVLIHYIDLKLPLDERRSRLRRQYYFECECPRCQSEAVGSPTVDYAQLSELEKSSCDITREFIAAEAGDLSKEDVLRFANAFYQVRCELLPLYARVYGPTHPFVRYIEESIAELKMRLDQVMPSVESNNDKAVVAANNQAGFAGKIRQLLTIKS